MAISEGKWLVIPILGEESVLAKTVSTHHLSLNTQREERGSFFVARLGSAGAEGGFPATRHSILFEFNSINPRKPCPDRPTAY